MVIFVLGSVSGNCGVVRTAAINTSTYKKSLKVSALFLETSRARRNAFTFANLGEKTKRFPEGRKTTKLFLELKNRTPRLNRGVRSAMDVKIRLPPGPRTRNSLETD